MRGVNKFRFLEKKFFLFFLKLLQIHFWVNSIIFKTFTIMHYCTSFSFFFVFLIFFKIIQLKLAYKFFSSKYLNFFFQKKKLLDKKDKIYKTLILKKIFLKNKIKRRSKKRIFKKIFRLRKHRRLARILRRMRILELFDLPVSRNKQYFRFLKKAKKRWQSHKILKFNLNFLIFFKNIKHILYKKEIKIRLFFFQKNYFFLYRIDFIKFFFNKKKINKQHKYKTFQFFIKSNSFYKLFDKFFFFKNKKNLFVFAEFDYNIAANCTNFLVQRNFRKINIRKVNVLKYYIFFKNIFYNFFFKKIQFYKLLYLSSKKACYSLLFLPEFYIFHNENINYFITPVFFKKYTNILPEFM